MTEIFGTYLRQLRKAKGLTLNLLHHPLAVAMIDLYQQYLDEPCPAIRAELKAKMDAIEARLKGETQHV